MIGKAPKHIAEGLFLWATGWIGGIRPIMLLEPILQRRGITKFR